MPDHVLPYPLDDQIADACAVLFRRALARNDVWPWIVIGPAYATRWALWLNWCDAPNG